MHLGRALSHFPGKQPHHPGAMQHELSRGAYRATMGKIFCSSARRTSGRFKNAPPRGHQTGGKTARLLEADAGH